MFGLDVQPLLASIANKGRSSRVGNVTQRSSPSVRSFSFWSNVQEEEPKSPKRKARRGGVKHPVRLWMQEALSKCSLCSFPGRSGFPGRKGEQQSSSFHLSLPLSPAAGRQLHPKGKKGGRHDVIAPRTAWDGRGGGQSSRQRFLMAEVNQKAARRGLLPHGSLGRNVFHPVIKKLRRLQPNVENVIHPVSRAPVPPFVKPETFSSLAAAALGLQWLRRGEGRRPGSLSGELSVRLHLLPTCLPSF